MQKYGGSSVANTARIQNVARRVAKAYSEYGKVAVVVSALQGETDRLLSLSKQLSPSPPAREVDVLLATGEQASASLLAIALTEMGLPAKSMLGHQVRIATDSHFGRARILGVDTDRINRELESGTIVVVAGFQGTAPNGDITTLGRGGSDTTSVALASALGARKCEIYTDVTGVFTTDPNLCPSARKIDVIDFEEMLELASLGAKVLETRSVEIARKYGVDIHVLSSFSDESGTLVTKRKLDMETPVVTGVACKKNVARITVFGITDKPGAAARLFRPISDAAINVDVIIQPVKSDGTTDISFTVDEPDFDETLRILNANLIAIGGTSVAGEKNLAKVSIVGLGMRIQHGIAAKLFEILASHDINIYMISTSEIKVSCVIDADKAQSAVVALHDGFGLAAQ